MSPALTLALAGLTFFGILLLMSVLLKITGGRFWAFPLQLMDPEKEKELGKRLYVLIRKIAPLPFLFF